MSNVVIPVLISVILFTLYDGCRKKHERQGGERLSLLYHAIGWILLFGITAYLYILNVGFTLAYFRELIWLAVLCWIIRDALFNYATGKNILYSGDGRGSAIEIMIYRMAQRTNTIYWLMYALIKLFVLIAAILITVI